MKERKKEIGKKKTMKISIELVCWLGPLHTFTPLSHTHLPKEIVGETKVYLHPPRIFTGPEN